jgi:CRP-like cAMP-binding protein
MTPREFLGWWRLGREVALRDVALTRAGASPDSLYFILDGTVEVMRGNTLVTTLASGAFVGEMSLITGHPANADADSVGEVRAQRWGRRDLEGLRQRDIGLWAKVQAAIGADLVEKIQRGDARLTGV